MSGNEDGAPGQGDGEETVGGRTLHSRVHFMCTTYETLTPLRINYAGKRQPLQPSGRVIGPFAFEPKAELIKKKEE